MTSKCKTHHILEVVLLLIALAGIPTGNSWADEESKYLKAVREFADNVLKYGRDTYGPKHTPLFVDGLNIHTHEPVKWIAPNGDRWILSNLASQQNLFRTLDGLTKITGDPKYRQAAVEAIKYAFENLQTPNGLLHWGGHQAYDAAADKPCGRGIHELKSFYPYYQLMWEVDPKATKQFIEAFWSGHILDWSNLDMDRHCYEMKAALEKPWKHEYKGGHAFFKGKGLSFSNTGSDLIYAAAWLTKLSGQKEPLVWAKRLAYRYVETRHPKTGISHWMYAKPSWRVRESYDSVMRKLVPGTTDFLPSDFPSYVFTNPIARKYHRGYCMPTPEISVSEQVFIWLSQFLLGEMLGSEGGEFKQWALEELTAFGRASYRKKDNVYVPILTDGTNLEGYVVKEDGPLGPKGVTLEPVPAGPSDLWAYTMGYCVTRDEFMWEMARSIALGNEFGDMGTTLEAEPKLNIQNRCSDPYALLDFLELHKNARNNAFLEMAKKNGDNILKTRFHKGFFVASNKHIYTKFDAIDSLVLLHLHLALAGKASTIPEVWPSMPFFDMPYRQKEAGGDNKIIYTLTKSPEPPMSLQEVAAVGDVGLVRALIEEGIGVDAIEDGFCKTALHRAAISGHKDVVELLLAEGADIDARDSYAASSLHYAVRRGHKDVAELLITNGADVNATNAAGDPPLQYAAYNDHKDIIKLLLEKGATISTVHLAAYMGDLAKLEAFIQEGVDINTLDGHGYAPLHYSAQNGQKEAAELLIAKRANVNVKNWDGQTPLYIALSRGHKDIIELLLSKGANINTVDNKGNALIHHAAEAGRKDIVELLIAKGADINAKNNQGQTPLDIAVTNNRKDIIELLLAKGADTSIHIAAQIGDLARVGKFVEGGANVNAKNNQGMTALHLAVQEKHQDVAKFLITKGADINAKDKSGYTPLYYAVWNEDKDMVRLLVTKGADVNFTPEKDYPPLHYAVWMEDIDIVKLFVANGVKFDVKDNDGWTAFRYAASQGNRELVEFFVSKGADVSSFHMAACVGDLARVKNFVEHGTDVDTKDELGWTALYWAVCTGQKEVAEFLIARGSNIHTKTNDGTTILHQAAQAGARELAELLISKGADVNTKAKNGNTPLHSAVSAGHREVVELLITKGANVDAKDRNDRTLLHSAALRGDRDVVEILLFKGADVNAKDRWGRTALRFAEQMGYKEIAELLRKHGAIE